jgi:uncharacterized membrane protein affecting hemolysin expression
MCVLYVVKISKWKKMERQRSHTNFLVTMFSMSFVSVDGVLLARNKHVHTARKRWISREYLATHGRELMYSMLIY